MKIEKKTILSFFQVENCICYHKPVTRSPTNLNEMGEKGHTAFNSVFSSFFQKNIKKKDSSLNYFIFPQKFKK